MSGIAAALTGKADYLQERAELCEATAFKLLKMAAKDKTRAKYLRAAEQRAEADEAAAIARTEAAMAPAEKDIHDGN